MEELKPSPMEEFWLWIMRRNAEKGIEAFRRKYKLLGLSFDFEWRAKRNLWGRFGGGWNWKLGIQAGGSTIVLSFLVCSLTISK